MVRPGGCFATAFESGDDGLRTAGRTLDLGIEFDICWLGRGESARALRDHPGVAFLRDDPEATFLAALVPAPEDDDER